MLHSKCQSILVICAILLTLSSHSSAQENRYFNIHQATHISAGWVAYDNGELYQCRFSKTDETAAPICKRATGLPSSMQRVSLLWAEGNNAWVSYTDGQIYGCRSQNNKGPTCVPASGLP